MPRLRSLRPTLLAAAVALAAGGAWLGLSNRSADAQQMQGGAPMPWQQQIANALPIFGSGNWVIIASTDFPLLSVNGVETIRVPDGLAAAVNSMEGIFQMSSRIRPTFHLASELDFAAKQNDDAKAYMDELAKILPETGVTKMPAADILQTIIDTAVMKRILVLKTDSMIPYGSVAIELAPGFWSPEQEQALRDAMKAGG